MTALLASRAQVVLIPTLSLTLLSLTLFPHTYPPSLSHPPFPLSHTCLTDPLFFSHPAPLTHSLTHPLLSRAQPFPCRSPLLPSLTDPLSFSHSPSSLSLTHLTRSLPLTHPPYSPISLPACLSLTPLLTHLTPRFPLTHSRRLSWTHSGSLCCIRLRRAGTPTYLPGVLR